MKYASPLFRFLLGRGWWTLWYGFFYLIVITGNFMWFGELYDWTMKGESGPAAGAVFIGLLTLGGLPLLLFSLLHLILAFWRGTDSRKRILVFGLLFLFVQVVWMIICPLYIAEASFAGFIAYYTCFTVFLVVNLALLWVTHQKKSLSVFMPYFFGRYRPTAGTYNAVR
ncbi:hypothetical protein Q0590_19050 [Rhodocytophaga aerolata]|uniref:Uncharacterized protein n=1 Tax=Rhodocytophaga aerolata TaxID=455078 RepID=A0ABT8R8F5_9BACT|nr:hypothetical protein [Rhodocytophaga aerolata]MDO1448382.1 hypothetical protein [Rhodocytophaga aerolata]